MKRLGRVAFARCSEMSAPRLSMASFVCRGDNRTLDQAIPIVGHGRLLPLLQHCQICPSCQRYFKETPSNDQSACERGKALLVPVFENQFIPLA